jgi:hypothetical protein
MIRSLGRRIRGRERETPTPADASSPGPTREAAAIEIAANDPLLPYLQDALGAVEIDSLELDSPAQCELRAEGIELVIPLVSQGELIGARRRAARRRRRDDEARARVAVAAGDVTVA